MDLEDIGSKIANLTMYDLKQVYRAAKNYALNVSEIEAKVDEATNDDPWGASSTLMTDIAQATHNFQDFNEIMPAIYRRFMEKEASEWRQIYKALQLLEYIVKHGSERVVDDARSHLSTIKILRNFHYIDESGKDQGINVRNRAKEISEMLSDVERIRQERRKARANKSKYQGAGNGDFAPGGGGRYGGFSSESYYAGGAGRYPDFANTPGGGAGGSSARGARDSFDEYDAGGDETRPAGGSSSRAGGAGRSGGAAPPPAPKKEEKVVDLFSFDDDDEPAAPAAAAPAPAAASKQPQQPVDAFGDDFDDFQAAPSATTGKAPAKPAGGANVFDFLDGGSAPAAAASKPAAFSTAAASSSAGPALRPMQPTRTTSTASAASTSSAAKPAAAAAQPSSFNFDDLWASSAGKPVSSGANQKKTMAELAASKSSAAVWGAPAAGAAPQGGASSQKKDLFDLL